VLFAGRERQYVAATALVVHRFAHQTAGGAPQIFLLAGEKAQIGAAIVEGNTQRLAVAQGHVGVIGAGRLQQP
jgi:hypothetical protein